MGLPSVPEVKRITLAFESVGAPSPRQTASIPDSLSPNPTVARTVAQSLSVSVTYAGCAGCTADCACVTSDTPAVYMPKVQATGQVLGSQGAVVMTLTLQSVATYVPGQANVLSFGLQSTANLNAGSNLTLIGLEGSFSPSASVVVGASRDATTVPASVRTNGTSSNVTITTPALVVAGTVLHVRLSLLNGATVTNWTNVQGSLSASLAACVLPACLANRSAFLGIDSLVLLPPQAVVPAPGLTPASTAPLLLVKSMSSLTGVAGAYNLLTVTLQV